jgi:inositol phosphorylceramide glucuronosyltransferase 1
VVFLDADTIVVRNMDEAFGCPGFCAAMRHSERLNSGVLVVEPSTHVFRDMLSKIAQLPSYTGYTQTSNDVKTCASCAQPSMG